MPTIIGIHIFFPHRKIKIKKEDKSRQQQEEKIPFVDFSALRSRTVETMNVCLFVLFDIFLFDRLFVCLFRCLSVSFFVCLSLVCYHFQIYSCSNSFYRYK